MSIPTGKSEFVAQRLLDQIVTSNLAPGSSLGTEASLIEQFGVSRPTLRESLRILESQGVLQLRPGPKGGIIVRKPGTDILAHGLSVYLRMHEVPFLAVLKAREVIGPALAAEAAENGSGEEFQLLEESIQRMKEIIGQDSFIEESRHFHSLIAKASGNHVMEIFWSTISTVAAGDGHGIQYSVKYQKSVIEAYEQILEACHNRDAERAEELMAEHVHDLENLVRKNYKHLLGQSTNIVSRQGSSSNRSSQSAWT